MSATRVHVDGIVLIISLLFASLFTLLGSSVYILYSEIEYNLMSTVMERLDDEGFQFSVRFEGRDGVVAGSAKDEDTIEEVISIAESVEGVRVIKNELTISRSEDSLLNNQNLDANNDIDGIDGITTDKAMGNEDLMESIGGIVDSTLPKLPADNSDPTIDEYQATESEKNSPSENLTEMTEKAVIEEIIIPYKLNITELASEDEVALTSVAKKMKNDPLLFIEMSSFHAKSVIAIKRTTMIKDFFVEHGIDKQHFDVLWHGSEEQNQVQLKLYRNE